MRTKLVAVVAVLAVAAVPAAASLPEGITGRTTVAAVNPIATDEATYQVYGRVFSDPHGCLRHGDLPPDDLPVSPWAKGNACAIDYLSYMEYIEGAKFLARRFPDLIQVIRLDQAYDNAGYMSAGPGRLVANEDGDLKPFGRDRSPLYLVKVTDQSSDIPEEQRHHFAYSGAIHGLERAGLEGGIRAMEDLVTWAACEQERYLDDTPACSSEGDFPEPKPIIESETTRDVPTAGDVLRQSVIYFFNPNPDGWRYGEKQPVEFRDGYPNTNYHPGPSFGRSNASGVDLNRDWPATGYTQKSHQPWSEPETRAFGEVLLDINERTEGGNFAGGIDLHGMLAAYAFSYTLLGADQRDYRKNELTVETSLRTWEDQTQRLRWSPWVADKSGTGQPDDGEVCFQASSGGTRDSVPACVADEWGTVFDTLGYTITGGLGFWMDDADIGLGAVGINNEMALSHLAPNNIYEPSLIQTHIDGNKGLIFSQIAALLLEEPVAFEPGGRVGYVHNPVQITEEGWSRPQNPGLPSQNDIDVQLPCRNDVAPQLPGGCGDGQFGNDGPNVTYEFDVLGPDEGFWNGGMIVQSTSAPQLVNSQVSVATGVDIQRQDPESGAWENVKTLQRTRTTLNDPEPGRYRISFLPAGTFPRRVQILFDRHTAEEDPGQLPIDASSMDFFDELNEFVPEGSKLVPVEIDELLATPEVLDELDTLVVVNNLGRAEYLGDTLGLSPADVSAYYAALDAFAAGGGNLVLTDAALHAMGPLGLLDPDAVRDLSGLASAYSFQTSSGHITYEDPERYPLAANVNQPGAAEQQPGRRQAVEPTTLGFNPNSGGSHARMPFHGVQRSAWEELCRHEDAALCTTSTTSVNGDTTNIGEVAHGEGVVRIVGSLLPDPLRTDDNIADNRFGLGSYALTYTAYYVFENLVDYRRH